MTDNKGVYQSWIIVFLVLGVIVSLQGCSHKTHKKQDTDNQVEIPSPLAGTNKVYDVRINVLLNNVGGAHIQEIWDMSLTNGTEVYLGRADMGDIQIRDLTVFDESGSTYLTDSSWDVNRSLSEKKGHCGLNAIPRGYEICWGIGEYGRHTYTISYQLTNLVKGLEDYDMIDYTFFSPNNFNADHVKITVEKTGFTIDAGTGLWGFGYDGYYGRENGKAVFESESMLTGDHLINVLMRFDKGIFEPQSKREGTFQDVLDRELQKVG